MDDPELAEAFHNAILSNTPRTHWAMQKAHVSFKPNLLIFLMIFLMPSQSLSSLTSRQRSDGTTSVDPSWAQGVEKFIMVSPKDTSVAGSIQD